MANEIPGQIEPLVQEDRRTTPIWYEWFLFLHRLITKGAVFSATLTTQQSITSGAWTKVNLDTISFDTSGYWDAVNKRYKPLIAGYYHFSWVVYGGGSTTLTRVISALWKNGAEYIWGADIVATTGIGASSGSGLVQFNGTTDYVELYALISATTPIIGITGASNNRLVRFTGEFVRPL